MEKKYEFVAQTADFEDAKVAVKAAYERGPPASYLTAQAK